MNGTAWTPEDDDALMAMLRARVSHTDAAAAIGRTLFSVKKRAAWLMSSKQQAMLRGWPKRDGVWPDGVTFDDVPASTLDMEIGRSRRRAIGSFMERAA